MKKLLFICLILTSPILIAQESNEHQNELKLNAGYSLLGALELSYEYLLNNESGLGGSILFVLNDSDELKFAFTPYYRKYFGKKKANGFFVETFGMLNVTESEIYYYYDYIPGPHYNISPDETNTETDFALGLSLGGKFITKKEYLFEIYIGIGRNLFHKNDLDAVPRAGLTIGKRF